MYRKLVTIGRRAVATSGSVGKRAGCVRAFSEFYAPYPKTNQVSDGHYLVQALIKGDWHTVEHSLNSGVDPNYRAEENQTPLMIAAENNLLDVIPMLLQHGANVNLQDDLGETALMKASRESCKEIVKLLLDHGAQADILNYEQMTARESTLDVEVDDILSSTQGESGQVTVEEHITMNIHSRKEGKEEIVQGPPPTIDLPKDV